MDTSWPAGQGSAAVLTAPQEPGPAAGRLVRRRSWRSLLLWRLQAGDGIWPEPAGPRHGTVPGSWAVGPALTVAVTAFVTAQYAAGRPVASVTGTIKPALTRAVDMCTSCALAVWPGRDRKADSGIGSASTSQRIFIMLLVIYLPLFLGCSFAASAIAFLAGRCGRRLPVDGQLPRVVQTARFGRADGQPRVAAQATKPSWPYVP